MTPQGLSPGDLITVSLDALVLLPDNQIREQMCLRTVREYAELMRGGEKFLPIKVTRTDATDDTRGFALVDGWHRVYADKAEWLRDIERRGGAPRTRGNRVVGCGGE